MSRNFSLLFVLLFITSSCSQHAATVARLVPRPVARAAKSTTAEDDAEGLQKFYVKQRAADGSNIPIDRYLTAAEKRKGMSVYSISKGKRLRNSPNRTRQRATLPTTAASRFFLQ